MGGICKQDPDYWCPLSTDDCQKLPCSCVLLTATRAGSEVLRKSRFMYIIKDGKMVLRRIEETYRER